MTRGEFLKAWREQVGLTTDFLAVLAKVPVERVGQIEGGAADAAFEELEALARALGLKSDDLLEDTFKLAPAGGDPLRLLLKSAEAFDPSALVKARMVGAARAALDLLDLRSELATSAGPSLDGLSVGIRLAQPPFKQGNEIAKSVRRKLGLRGGIESMRDLVSQRLGVPIVAADLTREGPDGFSVYAPGKRAAIVLNLVGRNSNSLVRRFTLAHEVCHLVIDRPTQAPLGVACWHELDRHLDIESRANAFAIRLLLPESTLTLLGRDVLKPAQFRRVIEEFGVHFRALQLTVTKSLNLTPGTKMPPVDPTPPRWVVDAEELPAEREDRFGVPLERRGELALLAVRAMSEGRLTRARVRELLQIDSLAPLDELGDYLGVPRAAAD